MTPGLANAWPFGHTKLANDPLRGWQVAHIYPPQLPGGRGSTQLELVDAVKTTLNLNRFFGMQELKVTKTTISCL